jgi:hypothetical protein
MNATKERCDLALENLALQQQLAVLKRGGKLPAIKKKDRLFWVWLSRIWKGWRESLVFVKPETVVGWHRKSFRLYWAKLSRRRCGGRPAVDPKVKALNEQVAKANPYDLAALRRFHRLRLYHHAGNTRCGGRGSIRKNKQRQTAFALARSYNHVEAISLLSSKIAGTKPLP